MTICSNVSDVTVAEVPKIILKCCTPSAFHYCVYVLCRRYHSWMQCPELQRLTASEPLTLDEEFEMQKAWANDEDSKKFLVCFRGHPTSHLNWNTLQCSFQNAPLLFYTMTRLNRTS